MPPDEAVPDVAADLHRAGVQRVAVMHAVVDRTVVADHRREPPQWLKHRSVARFEMSCVSLFHLAVAFVLLTFPRERVVTPGTSAIFGTIPLGVWAVWFTLIGSVAAACVYRNSDVRQALTWIGVFPTGAGWIYGISYAVSQGRGNAVFALTWVFLLLWWLTLAARLHFGGSGNRWDGTR